MHISTMTSGPTSEVGEETARFRARYEWLAVAAADLESAGQVLGFFGWQRRLGGCHVRRVIRFDFRQGRSGDAPRRCVCSLEGD